MSYKSFKFDIADGIAHVTFNQTERGNPVISTSTPSSTC